MKILGKYRIEKSELHKKNLGKHTLTDKLAYTGQITFGYATILKNREIFFTDAQYLNDYKERLSINDELKRFWEENYNKYDKCFYQLFKGIRVDSYEDNEFPYIDGSVTDESYRYFILSASMNKGILNRPCVPLPNEGKEKE